VQRARNRIAHVARHRRRAGAPQHIVHARGRLAAEEHLADEVAPRLVRRQLERERSGEQLEQADAHGVDIAAAVHLHKTTASLN
jgi:hypothetical protein